MATVNVNKMSQGALIKQIIKRYSTFGAKGPVAVPRGHFVVYVGESRSRYIVPITILASHEFQNLLELAAEEFGFDNEKGLSISCDQQVFESLVSMYAYY